ncbi:MAG TPA: hypothetical protein VLG69_01150 [Candidatus Andersenbacteria bacterium]|nr:hypothetical protein [Candidatus Andersenbacteria bacterium]
MKCFYCISTSSNLPEEIADELIAAAYEVVTTFRHKKKIHMDSCEGVVSTKYERSSLAGLRGILFHASLEGVPGSSKTTNVLFVVRPEDFGYLESSDELGAWMLPDEEEEDISSDRLRPNVIRRVKKKQYGN